MKVLQGRPGARQITIEQRILGDEREAPRGCQGSSGGAQRLVTLVTVKRHRRPLQRAALRRSDRHGAAFGDV